MQEIVAKKNCQLTGAEYGLVAYYNFNQGSPSGNNLAVTSLIDLSPAINTGTLSGFSLTGSFSNWISSGAPITSSCSPFGNLTINGNTQLCQGQTLSSILTASGAATYSWSNGLNTT